MKFNWIIWLMVICVFSSWLYAGDVQKEEITSKMQFCNLEMVKLNFDKITSPQQAGVPFKIKITAQSSKYQSLGDVFITDKTQSVIPKTISEFSPGNWLGTVTITKAGLTSITASYCGTTTSSNTFIVIPSSPSKLIVSPQEEVRTRARSNVEITGKVTDVYGNPLPKIECRLKVLDIFGDVGNLSQEMNITNNNGAIFATYTLPARFHQSKIEIKTIGTPTLTGISGTITTQPSIKTIL